MSKLGNIIEGWKNFIVTNEVLEPMFNDRFTTCVKCDKMKLGVCQVCLCVCAAKSRASLEECPLSRWLDSPHEAEDGNLYIIKANLPENLQALFSEDYIKYEKWQEFLKKKND